MALVFEPRMLPVNGCCKIPCSGYIRDAYVITDNGGCTHQVLPYLNNSYKATASANHILLFGYFTNGYDGFSAAFTKTGNWTTVVLPYVNQPYQGNGTK